VTEISARTLLGYATPHARFAAMAAAGMALEASVAAAFTYSLKPMLDDALVKRDPLTIQWLPWIVLMLFAVRALGVYIGDLFAARVSRSITRDMRERVFNHYLRLPSQYFVHQPSGPLLSRLTVELEQLGHSCTEGFKIIIADGLLLIGMLGVMLYHSVTLTLAVLLIGPAIGWIVSKVSKRFRRLNRNIQGSLGELTQRAQAAIQGEREIKIYGAAGLEEAAFAATNQHNFKQQLKVVSTNAISTSIVQFLAATALAMVIWIATREGHSSSGGMSAGAFMSFVSAMLVTLPSLKRLTNVQNLISRGVTAAGSIEQTLAEPSEQDSGELTIQDLRGEVQLEHVSVSYAAPSSGATSLQAETLALNDVTLTLKPGSITALVGRSGGGKSTLMGLIPRLWLPSTGVIRLDGVDIQQIKLSALRQHIAWVGQQQILTSRSVLQNVAYGVADPDANRAKQALIDAHAWEFVQQLPQGMDSVLGEQGASLSGGQKQRLALARALYRDAKILLLDEATSALDNESERAVQSALQMIRPRCTMLVIAHRLSTIEHADQIVVLEAGSVVEIGAHAELLARKSRYAELYQTGLERASVSVQKS
jgi:ATP-binding cassette, subfamily B, bacterial MsbA